MRMSLLLIISMLVTTSTCKHLNGEMHNDTASTKYLLAQIYQGHGEYEKAAQLKNEAIDCVEKLGYLEISKRWREESL